MRHAPTMFGSPAAETFIDNTGPHAYRSVYAGRGPDTIIMGKGYNRVHAGEDGSADFISGIGAERNEFFGGGGNDKMVDGAKQSALWPFHNSPASETAEDGDRDVIRFTNPPEARSLVHATTDAEDVTLVLHNAEVMKDHVLVSGPTHLEQAWFRPYGEDFFMHTGRFEGPNGFTLLAHFAPPNPHDPFSNHELVFDAPEIGPLVGGGYDFSHTGENPFDTFILG